MANEEEDLKVTQSQNLNEEAEYAGNKQDLEKMLLEAQRYLNIFHQIHIFNAEKKEEFNQSLIHLSDKLRAVILNLPGGRVLIEYIEDYEIKKGLRTARTVFNNDDPFVKNQKELEKTSAENKEFATAISNTLAETMAEFNKSLLQMNEKILQNSKNNSGNNANFASQAKILADALRENNQQQMEMMKTLGTTLSQAILASQKEILSQGAPAAGQVSDEASKRGAQAYTQQSAPYQATTKAQSYRSDSDPLPSKDPFAKSNMEKDPYLLDKNAKENKNGAAQSAPITPVTQTTKPATTTSTSAVMPLSSASLLAEARAKNNEKEVAKSGENQNKQEPVNQSKNEPKKAETEPLVKATDKKEESIDDIDIMSLLSDGDKKEDKKQDKKEIKETTKEDKKEEVKKEDKNENKKEIKETAKEDKKAEVKKEDKKEENKEDKKPQEKAETKFSPFSAVMQKIKSAITEPADMSLNELDITPVSLGGDEDDLTSSFTKAYTKAPKPGAPTKAPDDPTAAAEEEWEYVDENGNPIDPGEWEYVDENGNPVDPGEWEYVDEDGNPVDPNEWEYVDENGNPIS